MSSLFGGPHSVQPDRTTVFSSGDIIAGFLQKTTSSSNDAMNQTRFYANFPIRQIVLMVISCLVPRLSLASCLGYLLPRASVISCLVPRLSLASCLGFLLPRASVISCLVPRLSLASCLGYLLPRASSTFMACLTAEIQHIALEHLQSNDVFFYFIG